MHGELPSLHEIARTLRGKVSGHNRVLFSPPGHSGRGLEACLTIDPAFPDGFVVHDFSGGDDLALKDHLRQILSLPDWRPGVKRAHIVTAPVRCLDSEAHERDMRQRRHVAQSLWACSAEGRGSLAETYLASRGIRMERWPDTIRFLPASPPHHLWPTLVAAYGVPAEPEPGVITLRSAAVVGLQLTYLQRDGCGKAPVDPQKRSIGRGHVAPIVLVPQNDGLGLLIAEGIEDALSLHIETGLGAWAAGGAGRMPALAELVPNCTDSVTIVADSNDAGRKGARGLYEGLQDRGIGADVIFLDQPKDGNGGRDGT